MRKLSCILSLTVIFCLSGVTLRAQTRDTLFTDDPVLAMLDSLDRVGYLAKFSHQHPATNKFHYAVDSIPFFDNMVIESRLARLDAQTPFDLVYNDDVAAYIDMYMRRRKLVERMLGLSQLYYPMFEAMLDKYGLPLELKNLPVIESAMNPTATSRSGARGLWQFMYTTGKMYGLEANSYIDDRCDPYKATEAACQYLKSLYGMFGDWQIVLAAYNAGPGSITRAVRRAGGGKKTYWEIRPFLPRETQAYVPAFIAATYAMTYAPEHNLYPFAPLKTFFEVDTVHVKQAVSFEQVSSVLGVSYDELIFLNPMYKLEYIPASLNGDARALVLPASASGSFVMNEQKIYNFIQQDSNSVIVMTQSVKKTHTVKKGEYLTSIARKYGCTPSDIKTWNNLKSNSVYPGKKLIVYEVKAIPVSKSSTDKTVNKGTTTLPSDSAGTAVASADIKTGNTANDVTGGTGTVTDAGAKKSTVTGKTSYTIVRGDNLWKIAQKTGVSVEEIKKANGFGAKYSLLPGQKIKLPAKS